MGLYDLYIGSGFAISISIRGPNHADHERVHVELITSSGGVADPIVVFTGETRLSIGSAQANKHHIRLVRSGTSARLYINGVYDTSEVAPPALVATHGMPGT